MSYIILVYSLLSLFIILKYRKSNKTLWFILLVSGFVIANIGLAFYSEFVAYANLEQNILFREISSLLWKANYYLDLDLFDIYRLMNIGIIFYLVGALAFSFTLVPDHLLKRRIAILIIMAILFLISFDPATLKWLFVNQGSPYIGEPSGIRFPGAMKIWNLLGSLFVKGSILLSIYLLIHNYRRGLKFNKSRMFLLLISLIPIHLIVLALFYWFPNHNIQYRRLSLLRAISMPFNDMGYGLILGLTILSFVLLTFSIFRYNVLRMNVRQRHLSYKARVNTANSGMKVFSHSIKNQFIAVKLLSNQIQAMGSSPEVSSLAAKIEGICGNSIDQLGVLSQKMNDVSLIYTRQSLSELTDKVKKELTSLHPTLLLNCHFEDVLLNIDKHHFSEVMKNLILNSIEAESATGKTEISITVQKIHEYHVITLTDNGPGIPHKNLKHVFEPFFSTKPTVTNWGLGLSYCQQVIVAFGGSLELENNKNLGVDAKIYLPLPGGFK